VPAITPQRNRAPALMALLPAACSDAPPEPKRVNSDYSWSDRQEVIYQLQEVIRYEDEQERLQRDAQQAFSLPVDAATPAETGVATGEGENQRHQ
jgi:hypothetical protein